MIKHAIKSVLSMLLVLCMIMTLVPMAFAADKEVVVVLSSEGVTVDGAAVSEDSSSAVYFKKAVEPQADVEEGSELAALENSIITITKAGTYRFSGKMDDAQIVVRAGENDEVTIILDGVEITCRTAPAIMVYSAKETNEPGKGAATIYLAEGSSNKVTGSHTIKIADGDVKNDAAISSNVSLVIDGPGALDVTGDCEGIEVKAKHLTINDGVIHVVSADDPINGSEDGVAVVTINGGYLYVSAELGIEGDGIDSNGYIVINGGTVIALAHPSSQDSGLDSDMGTSINGGVVVGAGNMYDELADDSKQLFMMMQFSQSTDDLIVVTDAEDNPIFAYDFPSSYLYISFSTPLLAEGTYHVYIGGTITGTESDGLWTEITSYEGGEQMRHGGGTAAGEIGAPPEGMEPPEGMMPPEGNAPEGDMEGGAPAMMGPPPGGAPAADGEEMPAPPAWEEGAEPPEGMSPPPGGMGGPASSSEDATYDFVLSAENKVFTNVTSASMDAEAESEAVAPSFEDVPENAWYHGAVVEVVSVGLMQGVTDTQFNPNGTMNRAMLSTVLYRLAGEPEVEAAADFNDVAAEAWYSDAVAWAAESGIVDGYEDGTFRPTGAVTREQIAVLLYRFAEKQGYDVSETAELDGFDDADVVKAYSLDAMKWAVATGLIEGSDGLLNSGASVTRAQVATILVRFTALIENAAPVEPLPAPADTSAPEGEEPAAPEGEAGEPVEGEAPVADGEKTEADSETQSDVKDTDTKQ